MTWRTLLIQNRCRLNLQNRQFRVENDEGASTLALEDIAIIVLETPQATITSALLSQLSERGIALITCDETHTPNGILLSFQPHHRQLLQMQEQLAWSEPFKKRCWQQLIQQKIANQQKNLWVVDDTDIALRLEQLRQTVQSGDTTNREAVAAKIYWQAYFGSGFKRQSETWNSAALNYGYAIIRSALAKYLVAAGLSPALGLHHCSQLNAWNLADDLLEPFRPIVDRFVYQLAAHGNYQNAELSMEARHQLVGLLAQNCTFDGQCVNMILACELMVQGLVAAGKSKDVKKLKWVEH